MSRFFLTNVAFSLITSKLDKDFDEWASRICAVHASAAHIEKRELEVRAKAKIDEVIRKASELEKQTRP